MELYKQVQKGPVMKYVSVYHQMKDALMRGQWSFGEKISINELIEKFKVSRRPVMDAMKMLESEEFIEIIPQSGCKVVDYEKEEVLEQLFVSAGIESFSAGIAAIHHTDAEMEALESYQNSIRRNKERLHDKFYYFNYNREFHFHISSMTHLTRIKKLAMQMWDLNDFYLLNLFDQFKFDVIEQLDFHDKIMGFVKKRDQLMARNVMEEHLHSYMNKVKEGLAEGRF